MKKKRLVAMGIIFSMVISVLAPYSDIAKILDYPSVINVNAQVVDEYGTETNPYRILQIVPNTAMGTLKYLVSGSSKYDNATATTYGQSELTKLGDLISENDSTVFKYQLDSVEYKEISSMTTAEKTSGDWIEDSKIEFKHKNGYYNYVGTTGGSYKLDSAVPGYSYSGAGAEYLPNVINFTKDESVGNMDFFVNFSYDTGGTVGTKYVVDQVTDKVNGDYKKANFYVQSDNGSTKVKFKYSPAISNRQKYSIAKIEKNASGLYAAYEDYYKYSEDMSFNGTEDEDGNPKGRFDITFIPDDEGLYIVSETSVASASDGVTVKYDIPDYYIYDQFKGDYDISFRVATSADTGTLYNASYSISENNGNYAAVLDSTTPYRLAGEGEIGYYKYGYDYSFSYAENLSGQYQFVEDNSVGEELPEPLTETLIDTNQKFWFRNQTIYKTGYYKNNYLITNNDEFKKNVLGLDSSEERSEYYVVVDTVSPAQVNASVASASSTSLSCLQSANLIYISDYFDLTFKPLTSEADATKLNTFYSEANDLSWASMISLMKVITGADSTSRMAGLVIDYSTEGFTKANSTQKVNLYKLPYMCALYGASGFYNYFMNDFGISGVSTAIDTSGRYKYNNSTSNNLSYKYFIPTDKEMRGLMGLKIIDMATNSATNMFDYSHSVIENVYFNCASSGYDSLLGKSLISELYTSSNAEAFSEANTSITADTVRYSDGNNKLTPANLLYYIANYRSYYNIVTDKSELNILDVEPCNDFSLSSSFKLADKYSTVSTSYNNNVIISYNKSGQINTNSITDAQKMTLYFRSILRDFYGPINITQQISAEFIGEIGDLNMLYDVIYFGLNTGKLNTTTNNDTEKNPLGYAWTQYNDSNMDGYIYTHVGDRVIGDFKLGGLTSSILVNLSNGSTKVMPTSTPAVTATATAEVSPTPTPTPTPVPEYKMTVYFQNYDNEYEDVYVNYSLDGGTTWLTDNSSRGEKMSKVSNYGNNNNTRYYYYTIDLGTLSNVKVKFNGVYYTYNWWGRKTEHVDTFPSSDSYSLTATDTLSSYYKEDASNDMKSGKPSKVTAPTVSATPKPATAAPGSSTAAPTVESGYIFTELEAKEAYSGHRTGGTTINTIFSSGSTLISSLCAYRYSGNDLTKIINEKLQQYIDAGYAVVAEKGLYNCSSYKYVDSSSYIYKFFNDNSSSYDNIIDITEVNSGDNIKKLERAVGMEKLKINLVESPTEFDSTALDANGNNTSYNLQTVDGKKAVNITFNIEDKNAADTATYTAELYFDNDADGYYETKADGNNEVVRSKSKLSKGVDYNIYKTVTDDYAGVVTWCLKVYRENDRNGAFRTIKTGYTCFEASILSVDAHGKKTKDRPQIKVLQIAGDTQTVAGENTYVVNSNSSDAAYTNLEKQYYTNGTTFHTYASDLEDYELVIDTISVSNLVALYYNTPDDELFSYNGTLSSGKNIINNGTDGDVIGNKNYDNTNEFGIPTMSGSTGVTCTEPLKTNNYDMVIVGFGDSYSDIYQAFNAVAAYKVSDTTKLKAAQSALVQNLQYFIDSGRGIIFTHDTTSFINVDYTQDTLDVNPTASISEWKFKSEYFPFIGYDNTWNWGYAFNRFLRTRTGLNRFGVNEAEATVFDKATSPSGGTYKEIQGYSNGALSNCLYGKLTSTEYNNWYKDTFGANLKTSGSYDNVSKYNMYGMTNTKDIYFHSGNLETTKVSKVNDGQITNYPYKLGDMLSIKVTHSQYYQINMNAKGVSVWYTLAYDSGYSNASRLYAETPNDVANNYFIYSVGNVMYSGTGHRCFTKDGTVDEIKLFINTMIAAYIPPKDAGVIYIENSDEDITVTKPDGSTEKVSVIYTFSDADYEDEELETTASIDVIFSIDDSNASSSEEAQVTIMQDNEGTESEVAGVTLSPSVTLTEGKGTIKKGETYTLSVPTSLLFPTDASGNPIYKDSITLVLKANPSGTMEVVKKVKLVRRSIFDLN